MRFYYRFSSLLLLAVALSSSAAPSAPANRAAGKNALVRTNYLGWDNCFFLSGSAVRAVIVPNAGGRIVQYSLNGENVLFERLGQPSARADLGGYQCDVGPELRRLPPHEQLWAGPYEAEPSEDFGVILKSQADAKLGVAVEKEVMIDPESGDLGITQRLRNVSSAEISYCLWDRTLCKGGGFAFFRLKKKSQFPAHWSLRQGTQGSYTYDGAKPQSPNVKVLNGVLIAKCEGEPTKIGADTDAGWIAYVRGRWLFVKYFPYSAKGSYSDGGNSVELYFDHQVAELEPLSPEVKLKSGESYDFPEKWTLTELEDKITSFAEARALVNKIGASPFE
jgi:hypothetical protein